MVEILANSETALHFLASAWSLQHSRIVGKDEGANPDWIDGDLVMEKVDTFPHIGDAHKHILDNMLLLVELLYLLALCQFQQGHFRGY